MKIALYYQGAIEAENKDDDDDDDYGEYNFTLENHCKN